MNDGRLVGVVLTAGAVHDVGVTAAERLTLKDFRPAEGSRVFVARVRATTPLMLDAQVERDFTVDAATL